MSFLISGGTTRFRLHPPKSKTRGPRGIVGKHDKQAIRKKALDHAHTFDFAATKEKKQSIFAGVKRFFNKARGNR
jgi:hypothetical protein